jgi:hypothetical protein
MKTVVDWHIICDDSDLPLNDRQNASNMLLRIKNEHAEEGTRENTDDHNHVSNQYDDEDDDANPPDDALDSSNQKIVVVGNKIDSLSDDSIEENFFTQMKKCFADDEKFLRHSISCVSNEGMRRKGHVKCCVLDRPHLITSYTRSRFERIRKDYFIIS